MTEPHGHGAMVGALLCEPHDPTCAAGVIFFDNAGYLGMCGHGTIGLAVTLAHMGRLRPGRHRIETPVGAVGVELVDGCAATVENVESYRHLTAVSVEVAGLGTVRGDVAWGGNWFFLTSTSPCDLIPANVGQLTRAATAIRGALIDQGVSGKDGAPIEHASEAVAPLGHRPNAEQRAAIDDNPRRLALGMRIDDPHRAQSLAPRHDAYQERNVLNRRVARLSWDGLRTSRALSCRAYSSCP